MKQSRPIDVLCRPNFSYTSSAHTDIKATFRRLRREIREAEERAAAKRTGVVAINQRKAVK